MKYPRLAVEFSNFHLHYGHGRKLYRAVADIDLKIARGQIVGLIGGSGSGKTTLFKTIFGKLKPTKGTVRTSAPVLITKQGLIRRSWNRLFQPAPIPSDGLVPVRGFGRDRQIVYQHETLLNSLTAVENVAILPLLTETTIPQRMLMRGQFKLDKQFRMYLEQAKEIMIELGLEEYLHQYPKQLSGGQQRRVALACGLIARPQILMLDEPFKGLDSASRMRIHQILLRMYHNNVKAIKEGRDPETTVLIVDHYNEDLLITCDRIVGLSTMWDWQNAGYDKFPGATIIYDKPAPVFEVSDKNSAAMVELQAREMSEVLHIPYLNPTTNRTFWSEVEAGNVQGVLAHG